MVNNTDGKEHEKVRVSDIKVKEYRHTLKKLCGPILGSTCGLFYTALFNLKYNT